MFFPDIQELPNEDRNIVKEGNYFMVSEVRLNEILWANFFKQEGNL